MAALVTAFVVTSDARAAVPNPDLDSYVFFALEELRAKGLDVGFGNIGVNDGLLHVSDFLIAPNSEVVATRVELPASASCTTLFANDVQRPSPACGPAMSFVPPVIPDLAAACGFPAPFPACDPAAPVTVTEGQSLVLPAGVYGDLLLQGPPGATLTLTGGDYVFCSVKVGRGGRLLAAAPATVAVVDDVAFENAVQVGGGNPGDLELFVAGTAVKFSRQSQITALLCAPEAQLLIIEGSNLSGRFAARIIRSERVDVGGVAGVSTTTTPVTTTTTSLGSLPTTSAAPTTSTTTTTTIGPTTTTAAPTTTTTSTTTTTRPPGAFTRTPGFYKNHPAITADILAGVGQLVICGQPIVNVAVDDARSALEALCVSPRGNQRLSLARALTAAGLTMAAGGAVFVDFAACNATCVDPAATPMQLGDCIDAAADFNQSGDNQPFPVDPPGAANSGPCKAAARTDCTVLDPAACAAP